MPSFHLDKQATVKGISIFKTYQNIKQDFQKLFMTAASGEYVTKPISQSHEVSHVTTELTRVYSYHHFVKLFRLKYIVGYLLVDVSKAPSRTSCIRHTENKVKICRGWNNPKQNYSGTRLGVLREPLYILY